MRNFKITIFIVIATLTSVFIYSCTKENNEDKNIINNTITTENRSLCPSYLDVAGCTPFGGGTNTGGTLIYEGCSIPFQVLMYKCSWGVYFDPPIIDWNAVFAGVWTHGVQGPCTDLANKMLSLSIQGRPGEMNNLLLDIKKQASLFAQKRSIEFNSQINQFFYPCDGNNHPSNYSAVTQETNCTMFCQKVVPGTGIFITEHLCGAGCCTRKTPFCVTGPGEIVYGTPTYENAAPCTTNNNWFYSTTCQKEYTTLEVCNTACSKI